MRVTIRKAKKKFFAANSCLPKIFMDHRLIFPVPKYDYCNIVSQRLLYCFQMKAALSVPVIFVFKYSVILLLLHRHLQLNVSFDGFPQMEFVRMWWMKGTFLSVLSY